MKKILITGSCGFVFSNFIRKAIYEKYPYQFVSIDRVNGKNVNSIYWNKNHNFHVADITDSHIIDVIFQFEKPDIVIHGAAETIKQEEFINTNVTGTQIIIDACIKYHVEKLIYISTDEVYGQLISEEQAAWKEEDQINPRTPYAISKSLGESLIKGASESQGLIYNIIRSGNSYGPRQGIEKLIPKTIRCILNSEKIPIYGQGLQLRDWIHIFDNCSGILSVLENGIDNNIYNISANQNLNTLDVVQKICNIMGQGHNLMDFVKSPVEHGFRYHLNNAKIKSLNWEPKIKFKDGLLSVIEWFEQNKWALK